MAIELNLTEFAALMADGHRGIPADPLDQGTAEFLVEYALNYMMTCPTCKGTGKVPHTIELDGSCPEDCERVSIFDGSTPFYSNKVNVWRTRNLNASVEFLVSPRPTQTGGA